MNHFTNFFTKLKEYFKEVDVTIRIKEKNDRYTVMIIPEIANANGLKPLSITGTAKELDDDFFGKVQEAIGVWQGLASNIDEVKKDAADVANAAAQKKTEKPGNAPAKEKPAKGKSAKDKGKDPGKKKQSEPRTPEQRDIFSQAPVDDPAPESVPEDTPDETGGAAATELEPDEGQPE